MQISMKEYQRKESINKRYRKNTLERLEKVMKRMKETKKRQRIQEYSL